MENRFEDLKVWQLAHQYVLDVYAIIKKMPSDEKYGLIDQLRRSSSSIPTNIVEGNERKTTKEFIQFLYTSKGSLSESKYQLILACDLGYISKEDCTKLSNQGSEIGKMINGLIKYLRSRI